MSYQSWGRYPKVSHRVIEPYWISDINLAAIEGSILPYGQGRSYGDSCLNDGYTIISTRFLNRFISFDKVSGVLTCEGGVTLAEILEVIVPAGWFLPVTPGTKFVSIAGAVANDVHGKNHHREGTFGRHVRSITLLRSDNSVQVCTPYNRAELFQATIGGLGLTGMILDVTIQLKKISSPWVRMDSIKFKNLQQFLEISHESREFEYTVAWIDCLSKGRSFGRGIFMRGEHVDDPRRIKTSKKLSVPFNFPSWVLNPVTVKAFNFLYYHKQFQNEVKKNIHYNPFFYPLDSINNWNRIYGSNGFVQFQCVVPHHEGEYSIETILQMIVDSGEASFLAVIKEFGDVPSPGLLSFPRKGTTLALDFPFRGQKTRSLFSRLNERVKECGGALYPAKDALMTGEQFNTFYPALEEFKRYIDPKFSSSFWRRVTCET